MADNEVPDEVNDAIDESLGTDAPVKRGRRTKRQPSYKVVGASKIPVSKANGKVWKSRVAVGIRATEEVRGSWEQALAYYNNDQLSHRVSTGGGKRAGNTVGNQRLNNNITETENVVFANVTTMVPALYARNPEAEFTSHVEDKKELATTIERLVNVLGGRKAAPGINLKPKAKRCVVTTLLTNRSWIKIGWTPRQESSEQALIDLEKLSKKLEKAKTSKILQPAGPYAKVKTPFEIIVDPNAKEIDLTDAKWLIEEDMMPTEFILAKYAKKTKGSNEYKSIYQPTHVMKASLEGDESADNADTMSLFSDDTNATAKTFGFSDEESFEKAKMTKVYYVWDKVTRRVLLYNSKDWTWPIWVWDDPTQLDTFFPYYPLTFFESPMGPNTKGEVSYYLDQQDGINEISDEKRRARRWARRNIFFNSNVLSQDDATAILNGDDGTARGIDMPMESKLMDAIGSIPPPSIQFEKLFDKADLYEAIDRISSVGTVMRGEQFKTNTNKAAVQANAQAANMRVDEKSDQIEDWIGQIYWGIAQLCLMNMEEETVHNLIGPENVWENMSPEEITQLSNTVVGGSTQKPTSAAKKEEALEFGQVLGQFVNVAPGPVTIKMLEVMEKAFDEVTMKEEDWADLREAIAGKEQAEAQGGQQAPQQPPPPEQPNQAAQPEIANASPEQIQQLLDQLPPEVKQNVEAAIESGVPPAQALTSAIKLVQDQQSQQNASAPTQQLQ